MTNISSYIDYLPPVLWSQENDPSEFLGRMLRIFEKILTGIPDGIPINHSTHEQDKDGIPVDRTHEHNDFEKTIDELYHIFNPWKANEDFLPWLASWVALTLQKDWSEYQERKLISEMSSIYKNRGLKKGLHTYLDIYASTKAKPRIAIDDGDAIFRATFLDNDTAVLHTVAHSSEILGQAVLLHPSAIAADNNNYYIVVDLGSSLSDSPQPALWKVSSTGEIEYKSNNGIPEPRHIHMGDPLKKPTAVVVDKENKYIVVDAGEYQPENKPNSAIYRFDSNNSNITTVIGRGTFPVVYPVDMILTHNDDGSRQFVVLDRGKYPIGNASLSPQVNTGQKIVFVKESTLDEQYLLRTVIEPTALAMNSERFLIVADAKDQYDSEPADLVMVNCDDEIETSLLNNIKNNPLIFPVGLVFEDFQTLLVCDTGFRKGFTEDDENVKIMAEPAAIYRIKNLPQASDKSGSLKTPVITRVTYERKLVNPTKMMIDRKGKLIITDRGEFQGAGDNLGREWRGKANEFGIVVYFSKQALTSPADRKLINWKIKDVIDEQKPGHTSWWM
ncbi:phage tail protein [Methanosarcina sp.]|uniref:phage tail protein n=1 Tax=Methanosarcina sp. TaxID=2213 RepID=UPI003BB4CA9C